MQKLMWKFASTQYIFFMLYPRTEKHATLPSEKPSQMAKLEIPSDKVSVVKTKNTHFI